ncbi:hypothetical protein [Streptomyces echiniscabiei]|uniref:hypothetical protein n=1 Tax=Streptomyces echiniscabiei TaxID=3028708 RepID=UPI003FA3AF46
MDDLFTLPDLPPHTELIDGSLVFVSPRRRFHAKMIEIDPVNKTYALTGIHHDHLKLTAPYDIDVDITLDALKKV